MSWRKGRSEGHAEEKGQRRKGGGRGGGKSGWEEEYEWGQAGKKAGEAWWAEEGGEWGAATWQATGNGGGRRGESESWSEKRNGQEGKGRKGPSEADCENWRNPSGPASSDRFRALAESTNGSAPSQPSDGAKGKGSRRQKGDQTPSAPSAPTGQMLDLDLPIDEFREQILRHVRENRVTHIQGETGCGKSTRLPQFILEDANSRGEDIRMVVTQPRRMAAVTLAKRVAAVMGEELGQTVGYRISGDSIDGRLCFVTTGYLLQRLVNNPEDFGRYTHVILDEVHERGVDADLLSMLIKLLMHCCPEVKLIVMSATLQADLFAKYFAPLSPNNRPPDVLKVGARVFPVEQIFLDDIYNQFDFSASRDQRSLDNSLDMFAGRGKGKGKAKKGSNDGGFQRVEPSISDGLMEVTASLVQQLAQPGCTVIVFLPGIADITTLFETLAPLDDSRDIGGRFGAVTKRLDCPRLRVFALHSMIPRNEQEEVFNPVPKDQCHIVLASNIAESSLTLPDVCGVVDLALRRTVQYDTRRLMCCLVTTWCSQSSCKQRRGRAGRTMPGRAVCLVPKRFFNDQMPLFDPPEMMNAPLTKLYLQAKQLCTTLVGVTQRLSLPPNIRMDVTTPQSLLREVVQPPSMELLEAAMEELAMIGCLTTAEEDAEITPLGRIAIALPCDLRICRLLYFGCLFGCPADALAMAAGLTAADPFSAPSILVLKDQKDYVQKLERSFAARRWCDNGNFSEPLMLHTLFVEWIRAGAPRGSKQMGAFVRDWSIIPKKWESLVSDCMDLTVRFLKLLKPRNPARAKIEEMLAAMHHKVDNNEDMVKVGGWARPEQIFCRETDRLRSIIALAFSDQMLLHTSPKWAPQPGSKKKRQEEQLLDLMYKNEFDPLNTVGLFMPQGQDEASMSDAVLQMCGERPSRAHHDEKSKMLLVSFKPSTAKEALDHDKVLLWDVPATIHRMHMFGSGRYRFFVEVPGLEEGSVELFKPLHPFALSWEVLSHPGTGHNKSKKSPTVRGMCDWRNPIGFACHVDATLPATEMLGCCASVQGLEGGAQAFVAGSTALPLRFLPVLLGTLCPERWCVQWGVDVGSGQVRGLKILHHELLNLPKDTLAADVLEAVNTLRAAIKQALLPPSWAQGWENEWEDPQTRGQRGGRRNDDRADLLDPPDLAWLLEELLEVLPEGNTVQRPHKLKWRSAATCTGEWAEEDALRPYQALVDGEDLLHFNKAAVSSYDGGGGKGGGGGGGDKWSDLVSHLTKKGEVGLSLLPQNLRSNKKELAKRPDLFVLRSTNDNCYVRLASGAASAAAPGAAPGGKGKEKEKGGSQQSVGKQAQPLVDAILKSLQSKSSVGLGELGSQVFVKKYLGQQKGALQKIRPFLAAYPSFFSLGIDSNGQVAVALAGADKGVFVSHGVGKGPSEGKGGGGKDRGRKGGGVPGNAILTEHLTALCEDSPAQIEDFDGKVRRFLLDIQSQLGLEMLADAFDMLHEWLGKKEQRDEILNWPGYIMKLLHNWRIENEGESLTLQ